MKKRPLLEVCVDTPAGLIAAVEAGADRIELCAALPLAGLTPSLGMMRLAAGLSAPSYAMIRPRTGDFTYSAAELDVMRRDIDAAQAAGLPGVVFGACRSSGALDEGVLSALMRHAEGFGVTLHRAFDLAPDLGAALETAVGLGFERVLTSGGETTAERGANRIAELVTQAAGRISVMAGSGVNHANAAELLRRTGVTELHASCSKPSPPMRGSSRAKANDLAFEGEGQGEGGVSATPADVELAPPPPTPSPQGGGERLLALGFLPPALRETDPEAVRALLAVIGG